MILILFTLPGCTQAPDFPGSDTSKKASPVSDFQYEENEQGGITITKYIGVDSDVIIPEKIKNKTVTQIGLFAFSHNQELVSLKLSDSITLIGLSAFEGCEKLSSVSLSQKLELIDNCAFKSCPKLSEIALPNTLTSIGSSVFLNCSSLKAITLPDSLTTIGMHAFENCTSLKHINIPKNLIDLKDYSFTCSGIETIEFENGIEKIGKNITHC